MMLTLEPQDDFQAHLVQVLLAKIQVTLYFVH